MRYDAEGDGAGGHNPARGLLCLREEAHAAHDFCPGLAAHPATMIGQDRRPPMPAPRPCKHGRQSCEECHHV